MQLEQFLEFSANRYPEKVALVFEEQKLTYSQIDRIVVGGVMPLAGPVGLPEGIGRTFGVDFFLQRREMGMINIGGPARVVIDGETFSVGPT